MSGALAADSRERAVRALLRTPSLKQLWSAQLAGGVGDALGLLVMVLLGLQAAAVAGAFGGGYRGVALAVAAVIGVRLVAALLFGAVLLGPLSSLLGAGGRLDRRWTMVGADAVRALLLAVAPVWIDFSHDKALPVLLVSAFLLGVAERVWTAAKDAAAPALLPAPPPEGDAVRPLPDHLDALRRLWLRTSFVALPLAAAALLLVTLLGKLLAVWLDWFDLHQAALGSYLGAALFTASAVILYFLLLPGAETVPVRSPLQGLRRPRHGQHPDTGRTGAIPVLVLACAAVAGAIAAAAGVAVLQAMDMAGGPADFALLALALSGGPVLGIRAAVRVLPGFSRRRLLALALALTGLALLAAGLVPDATTVLLLMLLAGVAAGVAAATGHHLLDQETEEARRARLTEHLHAVVRVTVALGAVAAPVLAAVIGPHRLAGGGVVFAHGGAAFTLMLIGALLLPVAALVLGKTDDRHGVPVHRDLLDVVRGGDPDQAPASTGFFIAFEGGDGAGKSTQVQAIAEWIRGKGHEVVVTREPGATPIGKRLRAILLDVSSAGLSDRAEALLYAADRAEHVDSLVRPALARGAVVITDRYIDSSVAYQGAGRDLSPTEIARINRWATGGLVPNLTVLLDVSPETARERFTEAPDRLESEPAEFHQRVRTGFLTLAAADPARYLVVDAGQQPDEVTTVVRHHLDRVLPLSAAEVKAREEARKAAEEEARRKAEEEAARKAEEERLERERQEQLARLRAEEEERRRREQEEAQRREAERQAEEARKRAEETRRRVEEERKRREAEERARAAEQERLRKQAEEEARLRAEAEERRLEKQRKAEEALLRAEEARLAAEAEAAAGAGVSGAGGDAGAGVSGAGDAAVASGSAGRPSLRKAAPEAGREHADSERTETLPVNRADEGERTEVLPRPGAAETEVLPPVRGAEAAAETEVMPSVRGAEPAAETEVLPPVRGVEPAAETEVLPPVRGVEPAAETEVLPSVRGAEPAAETEVMPSVHRPDPRERAGMRDTDETLTVETPVVHRRDPREGPWGAAAEDETTVLPPVRGAGPAQQRVTWGVPSGNEAGNAAASDAGKSAGKKADAGAKAAGPARRPAAPARPEDPVERVPDWLFRPEDPRQAPEPQAPRDAADGDRTRELPRVEDRKPRRRPGWSQEETGEQPSLADDLFGRRDEK